MKSIAIVGAGGVLGAKLVERALQQTDAHISAFVHNSIPAIAATSQQITWEALNITDSNAIAAALTRAHPEVVFNCAAMTNVDACELQREEALATNGTGPHKLAEVCVRLGAGLIHVSTDYVFPGDDEQPGPYLENAPVHPVNYYGWTKLQGELAVENTCTGRVPWLVVRTALVYGHIPGGRTNFVKWLVGELRARRRVKIVSDQFNTPTLADDLAAVLLHLSHAGSENIIHVAGPDLLARTEWARIIALHYGLDVGLIDEVSTAELKQPAIRPLRSGLQSGRIAEWQSLALRGVSEGLTMLGLS